MIWYVKGAKQQDNLLSVYDKEKMLRTFSLPTIVLLYEWHSAGKPMQQKFWPYSNILTSHSSAVNSEPYCEWLKYSFQTGFLVEYKDTFVCKVKCLCMRVCITYWAISYETMNHFHYISIECIVHYCSMLFHLPSWLVGENFLDLD